MDYMCIFMFKQIFQMRIFHACNIRKDNHRMKYPVNKGTYRFF